ncbi:DUF4252 domain-containing protein [candidate division KSB1 bacterium]|nr:DUF4252 domain-containing protein [candidate division KSB1 bacterium]
MKRTLVYNITFLLVIMLCFPALSSADDAYKNHPGYVDFGNLEGFMDAEETVEVFIRGPLLKFVSKATQKEDPDLSKLLDNLVVIKVNVFSLEGKDENKVLTLMKDVSKKLTSKNWEAMVRVKEQDERVEIFTLFDKADEMQGLTLMVLDNGDHEAVFINIAGKIDPEQLGKLGDKLNIPELNDVKIDTNTEKK